MKTSIEIPVGPQHPALHEPLMLKVRVDGEHVENVQVITGYNHRGIEKLGESKSFLQAMYVFGRVCGICNIVHQLTYVQVLEKIGNIEVPPRARYLRSLVSELERIHSHLLVLAVEAEIMGFQGLFMLIMRDREPVMKLKEIVTGQRVIADFMWPGGVKRDIDDQKIQTIKKTLDLLKVRMKKYKQVFSEDSTVLNRLKGVGIIKKNEAVQYGLVGPTARGSGVKTDIRKDEPYAAFGEIPFNLITYSEGDSWARMLVRIDEIFESINIIEYLLDHLPTGPIAPKFIKRRYPEGEAISRSEAPRGELLYHMISKGGDKPYRVKVRTPSFPNILNGSRIAFRDVVLADVPVIFGSFDPCISCMERIIVVNQNGDERIINIRELRK
ncbi:MAG: nickel-dependent hydrogenase large subunit [Thermoproteales archaeon]|nr:nickel-dependent hydrogenase large subunit [Thermoproteales archaeon]